MIIAKLFLMTFTYLAQYVAKVGNTVRSASPRKKALFIGLFGKRPSFQVFSSSNKMWYFLELLKNISKSQFNQYLSLFQNAK